MRPRRHAFHAAARPWVLLVVVAGFVLTGLVTDGLSASASPGTMVPVVACPSQYGAGPLTGLPALPGHMNLDQSPAVAAELSFYTDHTRMLAPVLAPRGWSCRVLIGADGSGEVNVYPGGSPQPGPTSGKPLVSALSDGACQGCVWGAVCPYVKDAGKQLGQPGLPCPGGPKGEKVTWLKGSAAKVTPPVHDVIATAVPTKPDPSRGVVLYDYVKGEGYASTGECTLPAGERPLCSDILEFFITQKWLM